MDPDEVQHAVLMRHEISEPDSGGGAALVNRPLSDSIAVLAAHLCLFGKEFAWTSAHA